MLSPPDTNGRLTPSRTDDPWKGVTVGGVQYGPFALEYFTHRMANFLNIDVSPAPPVMDMFFNHPTNDKECDAMAQATQDSFIDLYWLGYHVNFPLIDRDDFSALYASLRRENWEPSAADPLVDIVLALTIQYAYSFHDLDGEDEAGLPMNSASAGVIFYRRSQCALQPSLEYPSLKAVQCRFLAAVYLFCAACYNAGEIMLRMATDSLNMLTFEGKEKELAMQTRRCARIMQIRLQMRLGRLPRLLPRSSSSLEFQEDDWSVFHRQLHRLSEVVEEISFNTKRYWAEALSKASASDPYSDPVVRNDIARAVHAEMAKMRTWAHQVPSFLRYGSDSFSTTTASLTLDDQIPMWLQRQRVLLECNYHDFCVALLRILIPFSPVPVSSSVAFDADSLCISAANHAMCLTRILHQIQTTTDILTGCYQGLEWQTNAAYLLAGFAVSHPICPPTPLVRKSLRQAGEVFGLYGPLSHQAARMKMLCSVLDERISGIVAGLMGAAKNASPGTWSGRTVTSEHSSIEDTEAGVIWQAEAPVDPALFNGLDKDDAQPIDALSDEDQDSIRVAT